jgi:hypothetical protein
VIGRGFGHEEVLAYQEPNRAANPTGGKSPRQTESGAAVSQRRRAMANSARQAVGWVSNSAPRRTGASGIRTSPQGRN